jgi:hypothetical protein
MRVVEEEFQPTTQPTTQPADQPAEISLRLIRRRETIKVEQPQNPIDAATVRIVTAAPSGTTPGTVIDLSTGKSSAVEFDQAIAQTKPLTWVGMAFCAGGLALFILKVKIPTLPWWTGLACIGTGGVFIIIPVLLDRYSHWIMGGIAAVLLGGLILTGWRLGWFDRETGPEAQTRLKGRGQDDAAGALAFVHSGGKKDVAKLVQGKAKTP